MTQAERRAVNRLNRITGEEFADSRQAMEYPDALHEALIAAEIDLDHIAGTSLAGIWDQAHQNHAKYSATGEQEQDLRFLTLGLVGEAGELANFVKKRWRDGSPINNCTGELHLDACRNEVADVLAYTMMVAQRLGMTPESLIQTVREKQFVFVAKMQARGK